MADEVGSNAYFRGAGQRRYLRLIVMAAIVLAVLALLAARVRPFSTNKFVSVINHGHVVVCPVTPEGDLACPPLSSSPSKSYSPSKSVSATTSLKPPSLSKSVSPSKSISTSTSLLPPSTSTSLSPNVHAR